MANTTEPPSAPPPQSFSIGGQQYLVSDNQVLVAVYVNAIWGGLCIFGFVVLRGWVRGPGGVFQRRQELQDLFMRPPRLLLGSVRQVWNWVLPLLAVSDADIVSCSGFDGLVLTRVLLIGLQLFTIMSLLGLVVLIPVYYTRGGVESSSANLGTMARLSVANIPTGSQIYLLPFFMTYAFIGYGCWVLLVNCKCYAQLRMAYFTCLDALPSALQPEVPGGYADAAAVASAAGPEAEGAASVPADPGAAARAAAAAAAAGGASASGADSSSTGCAAQGGSRARDAVTLEMPQLRDYCCGGRDAVVPMSGARPVAEGLEWGDGSGGDGAAAAGAAATPVMELKSTWLNMANFFNPTLRMMLDYLDWQRPLHRTAARFGLRGLQLPTVASDEVPRGARLYGKGDPLLQYDNLVMKYDSLVASREMKPQQQTLEGRGDVATAARAKLSPPASGGEEMAGSGVEVQREGQAARGGGDAAVAAAAVLPYWRPLAALGLMRRTESASTTMGGGGAGDGSSARFRKVAMSGVAATAGEAACSGGEGGGRPAAAAGGGTAAATAGPLGGFPVLRYSLRHCNTSKPEQLETLTAALTAAPSSYGIQDPRQPLLPGKRNVRLLQLLQVPMRTAHGDGAGGGAAGGGNRGISGVSRSTLRSTSMRPAGRGSGADGGAVTTEDGDDDPVRLVNANHYVVLIKRVHLKHGPSLTDRMAAATYITLSRIRSTALWAVGRAAGGAAAAAAAASITTAADALSYVSYGKRSSRPAASAPGLGGGGGGGGGGSRSGRGLHTASFRSRTAREVEAQAVSVAAVAAAAPLRGVAKAVHDVRRYFEMFEDPGHRHYDPLSDVCATDARGGKAGKAGRRAGGGGGGGGGGSRGTSAGGAAPEGESRGGADGDAAAASAAAAAVVPEALAAAAAKTEADAAEDPNGAAVAAELRDLFPKSFQGLIPVTNHDSVDKLIYRWDAKMLALAAVVRDLERLQVRQQRHHHADVEAAATAVTAATAKEGDAAAEPAAGGGRCGGGCGRCGDGPAAAEAAEAEKLRQRAAKLRANIRELESRIEAERERVLRQPVGTAYFALFSNSQDAQMLAQCRRVVPPQGPGCLLSFDAVPAPAPDDVSWPGLWSSGSLEQMLRRLAIVLPMAAIFALPIGPLQGALASLDVSLCGGATSFEGIQLNKLYVEWFCEPANAAVKLWKNLLTGVLPSVLGLVWTSVCMPLLLYTCSSISRRELSLSGQERQMQGWFFWYSMVNTFLGAVLGGGALSQLGAYLADPQSLLDKVGRALPSSANFFIQFCIARALFTNFVRLIWPHAGSMLTAIFRALLRLGRPTSLHAAALAHMPPSSRAASFYNAILQVFMFGCAFAVVAPVILPCCWLFFLTGFFAYRYSILYVYERSYESGGQMWPVLFDQIMGIFMLMEAFSGAVFIVNKAWVLAGVMWITLTPALLVFWRYCTRHYLEPLTFPPLSVVAAEPRGVRLSPLVYMPPALRPGAVGWYPEQGKVWEKYGIPKHV